jgi:hypothetical protein
MVSIPERRGETIPFLVGLATDEGAPEAVRIAAYSAFEDLFGTVSAPEADQLVEACLRMPRSPRAVIGQGGALLLHNFARRGGPPPVPDLQERALSAIRRAHADEADDAVRLHLEWLVKLAADSDG